MSASLDLKDALARMPENPGIYRMINVQGETIYIGKAKNLRNRVRSYFRGDGSHLTPRIQAMVAQVHHIETVLTDTEVEALILEANLIKTVQPKYNVLLRDDKKYPWIGLTNEAYPRLFLTRRPVRLGKTRYFGPYTNSGDLYATLQLLRRYFPMRQRRKPLFKHRPCMNYSIGLCPGPCQGLISQDDYAQTVRQVELFLTGHTQELSQILQRDMEVASDQLQFERAAKLRDALNAIESVVSRQKVVSADSRINQDIIAAAADDLRCAVVVMAIRHGKIIGTRMHDIPLTHGTTVAEAFAAALPLHYEPLSAGELPEAVLLQYAVDDMPVLQEWLSQKRGKTVQLQTPQRGLKHALLQLAEKNARDALDQFKVAEATRLRNDPAQALLDLQEALGLPEYPTRMECYDISHFQGTHTVASMVVFTDGVPDKAAYRRFKIRSATAGQPDDFKSMAEVMARRAAHFGEPGWEEPDLIIIDGGKGQLSTAVEALGQVGVVGQPIISLAKKFEEVFLPGESRPVVLPRDSRSLFLLQQIRDEAHRFAVGTHRQAREKAATVSVLDGIPGVGPKRREKLLTHFGSVDNIRKADATDIARLLSIPQPMAQRLLEALSQSQPTRA